MGFGAKVAVVSLSLTLTRFFHFFFKYNIFPLLLLSDVTVGSYFLPL